MIGTKASIMAIRRVGLNTTMVAALKGGLDARDAERACDPVVRRTAPGINNIIFKYISESCL
jgi:hypothetical protein